MTALSMLSRVAAAFCGASLLAGCAAQAPRTVYLKPTIPERLLDCPARPTPPEPPARQRDVALFLIDLDQAHGTCRARLHALAGLLHDAPLADARRP